MHENFVLVNGIETHVACWGKWIEDDLTGCQEIILAFPGNPGLIDYYKEFLDTVYENLKIPIWILSHAGHESPPANNLPVRKLKLYDLKQQVEHKISFIKKYVPTNLKLYLIGHSIGCKMILDVLKSGEIESNTTKCYLLFPTIERMAESPNGKFLTCIVLKIVPLIIFLSWIFMLFPYFLQVILVRLYFLFRGCNYSMVEVTVKLINPTILKNVFFLAGDEMLNVKELDHHTLKSNRDILFLYYGASDNWAPVNYFEDLKKHHPGVRAEVCNSDFEHAFVLNNGKEMGICVSNWIKSDRTVS